MGVCTRAFVVAETCQQAVIALRKTDAEAELDRLKTERGSILQDEPVETPMQSKSHDLSTYSEPELELTTFVHSSQVPFAGQGALLSRRSPLSSVKESDDTASHTSTPLRSRLKYSKSAQGDRFGAESVTPSNNSMGLRRNVSAIHPGSTSAQLSPVRPDLRKRHTSPVHRPSSFPMMPPLTKVTSHESKDALSTSTTGIPHEPTPQSELRGHLVLCVCYEELKFSPILYFLRPLRVRSADPVVILYEHAGALCIMSESVRAFNTGADLYKIYA
jgi:hypothetical protein